MPLKKETSRKRQIQKRILWDQGLQMLSSGKETQAIKSMLKGSYICPELVFALKERLSQKFRSKDCEQIEQICSNGSQKPGYLEIIIAPFEADTQLAYMSKQGLVDLVICEDSDLIMYGAKQIFYKMKSNLSGHLLSTDSIFNNPKLKMQDWSQDRFIQMCILSGCDFWTSNPTFGIHRAYNYFLKNSNLKNIEAKIGAELIWTFKKAFLAIKFAIVFCPLKNCLTTLNPLSYQYKDFFMVSDWSKQIITIPTLFEYQCLKDVFINYNDTNRPILYDTKINHPVMLAVIKGEIDPHTFEPFSGQYLTLRSTPKQFNSSQSSLDFFCRKQKKKFFNSGKIRKMVNPILNSLKKLKKKRKL